MRKELPWTLEEKKSQKTTKKVGKGSLTMSIKSLFKENKNKKFSAAEISNLFNCSGSMARRVLYEFYKNKEIKIVEFKGSTTKNSLLPLYQNITGKDKAVEVIDCNSTKCKKLKLVSIHGFLENYEDSASNTSVLSKLKKKAEKAKIEKTYVKTSTKYACYYKEDDLKNLIIKKKSVKNKRRPRKVKAEKNKPISFNFFGLKISISK